MATFDLRITRRQDWMEPCADDITEAEWRALVDADPELAWVGTAEGKTHKGELIRFASPLLAAWTAHPKGEETWLDFCEGSVIISDPDADTIDKIRALADLLHASVQGNDGEPYT